ncbi:MAG: M24 family metallopeptidase, partial [Chloroflexota bacterium]
LLSDAIPGASGVSIVFADHPTADTIEYCLEGNLTRQARIHTSWIKTENIRTYYTLEPSIGPEMLALHAKKQAQDMVGAIKAKGLLKEKVAYDALSPLLQEALQKEGLKLVYAPEVMDEARKLKTMDEVNCMRLGGVIADAGWGAMFQHLRPGMTERELGSKMSEAVFVKQQAGHPIISLRSGPNTAPNWLSHSPSDRTIEAGDLLFCDMIDCGYSGYNSCYYRTWKCGTKPTQKEKDMYKQVYDWLYSAAEELKPGKTTADAARKWPPASTWGYKEEYEPWSNCLGHGQGLMTYELPRINRFCSIDYPQVIEVGMVIALETWTGEDGVGGVRLENMGVVTKNGWENIYQWPDEEITCPQHQLIFGY